MSVMPVTLQWSDLVIRLVLAVLAGAVIGLNRTEAGKTAGLRTTMLVCLAACLAMLQVNALLAQAGKHGDSFAVLDLMRLPLGILTGMGFIGAGAVLRKDGPVTGVTTAATLWFVTVAGLCIGGGQLVLGVIGLGLGVAVLWGLRAAEHRLRRHKTAWLTVEYEPDSPCRQLLVQALTKAGCACVTRGLRHLQSPGTCEEKFMVQWRERFDLDTMSSVLTASAITAGAKAVNWSMVD